jgi:hypothetical protein
LTTLFPMNPFARTGSLTVSAEPCLLRMSLPFCSGISSTGYSTDSVPGYVIPNELTCSNYSQGTAHRDSVIDYASDELTCSNRFHIKPDSAN